MSEQRVTLVMFGAVEPSNVGADGSAWELARALHSEGRLGRVLCTHSTADDPAVPRRLITTPFPRLHALGCWLLDFADRRLPHGTRNLRERWFDLLVSRSSEIAHADAIVFRKPNFLRTVSRAKRLGIPTLAIASICHPERNYERVTREAARLGIDDRSPYRDRKRVARVSKFFERCDRILTTPHVGEGSFLEHGIPAAKLVTTPLMNGADCERFRPAEPSPALPPIRFLHLSAMNLIKGVSLLFEAWARLAPANAELRMAGPMDDGSEAAFRSIQPPACRLLGPIADTPACYREAHVFVSPSLSDSAPNTVLEAMASGLPVIVSDGCGASLLVEDGCNGFVYPYDDGEALKRHLRWFCENPEAIPAMGAAARATALANQRSHFAERVSSSLDGLGDPARPPGTT